MLDDRFRVSLTGMFEPLDAAMPRALAPRSPPPEADVVPGVDGSEVDPQERIESLLAHLGTRSDGLSSREAERRLTQFGRNEITRTVQRSWPVVSE